MTAMRPTVCCAVLLIAILAPCRRMRNRGHSPNLPLYRSPVIVSRTMPSLKNGLVFRRAVQLYRWALPVLNMYGTKEGSAPTHS